MLNDCQKYIRYRAYGELRKLFINTCKISGVKRTTVTKLQSVLHDCYTALRDSVERPVVDVTDELPLIVAKKKEFADNNYFISMLKEAFDSYSNMLSDMDRPTINHVEKQSKVMLDNIINDFLEL